jgi:hypothetical protein
MRISQRLHRRKKRTSRDGVKFVLLREGAILRGEWIDGVLVVWSGEEGGRVTKVLRLRVLRLGISRRVNHRIGGVNGLSCRRVWSRRGMDDERSGRSGWISWMRSLVVVVVGEERSIAPPNFKLGLQRCVERTPKRRNLARMRVAENMRMGPQLV